MILDEQSKAEQINNGSVDEEQLDFILDPWIMPKEREVKELISLDIPLLPDSSFKIEGAGADKEDNFSARTRKIVEEVGSEVTEEVAE